MSRYPIYRVVQAKEIASGDPEKLTRASVAIAAKEKRSLPEIYRALR